MEYRLMIHVVNMGVFVTDLYNVRMNKDALNNLQHWLKSRRVVAQSTGDEAVFITLQDL